MLKVHKQVKELATDTTAPADVIPFEDAVREGKQLIAKIDEAERSQLRLGELADKLEPKYADRTLAKFANAIGIEKSTLNHYRTVYRHWKNILPPGAKLPSFAVLKELASLDDRAELIAAEPNMSKRRAEVHRLLKDHPQREEILSEHPGLSCTKDARKIMAGGAKGAGNGKGSSDKDYKRWFNALVKRCHEDMDEAAIVDQPMDVEQLRNLLEGIEPALLETVKEAGAAWLALYNFLTKLCEEGPVAVFEERERAKANVAKANGAKKAPTIQSPAPAQMGA